jgi:2-polyprenyl-3-methyl-5-hydroxy-6-metoxy-1,4-benzoquinol methylase
MKCSVCDNEMKLLTNKKYLHQCDNCKHIFKKIDNNDEIQKKYHATIAKNPIKFNSDGNINAVFHKQRELIVSQRLEVIEKYLNKNITVLDVGGSAGTFANKIRDYVKNVEITDLADYQKKESERLGFIFYQGDFNKIEFNKKYDLVTSWHVLEHVEDVNTFLPKIKSLSKNMVILEIPYARKINENITDGHVQYFNERSFRILLEKYFSVIEIREGIQKPALLAICKVK